MSFHTEYIYTAYGNVRNLLAEVVGYRSLLVTWTPPSPAPPLGYHLSVPTANITVAVIMATSYIAEVPRGLHTIQVRPRSMHYISEVVSTNVTVRGEERVTLQSSLACWSIRRMHISLSTF